MLFIPDDYSPPQTYQSSLFRLEILSPKFAAEDFASVTASANDIRHVFGPTSGWPSPDISYTENLADLQRHEREFFERKAFAYSILSHDRGAYVGCLYIEPIKSKIDNDFRKSMHDAQAFFWLGTQEHSGILAEQVLVDLQIWLEEVWPFRAVAFPGRTIGWSAWEQMAKGGH